MDVQMQELDGLETTKKIRASVGSLNSSIKIIALTTNAMQGDREMCLAVGMDDYLTKPFSQRDLERIFGDRHIPDNTKFG